MYKSGALSMAMSIATQKIMIFATSQHFEIKALNERSLIFLINGKHVLSKTHYMGSWY